MNTSILLIETEGTVLEKLQQNSLMQRLNTNIDYTQDPLFAVDMIAQQSVGVVVAKFDHNLEDCHDFCLQVRKQTSSFIMIVLLIDEKHAGAANEFKYAHQTLALPCAEKEVVAAINRGLQASNEVYNNPKLSTLVSKLDLIRKDLPPHTETPLKIKPQRHNYEVS